MSKLKPYIINGILSFTLRDIKRALQEMKRKLMHRPHTLTVFVAIDDPNSYLLLQVLPELQARFPIAIELKTVLHKRDDMFPEISLWDANVLSDAQHLAELYALTPPMSAQLTSETKHELSLVLVSYEGSDQAINQMRKIFDSVWQNGKPESLSESDINRVAASEQALLGERLRQNEARLAHHGHYLPGVIHYAGEWYWGLERILYLEKRLNVLCKPDTINVNYDKLHSKRAVDSKCLISPNSPLTLYFSIRSPYSYIGLLRAAELAKQYSIPLILKPVLPMVMRGLPVPKQKRMYIALDAKREATTHNIPFGLIADPLGIAVERCYALFEYAASENKQLQFMTTFAKSVWSQGIDAATDEGLKAIVEASALSWEKAQPLLSNKAWHVWAQQHLEEMYGKGMWGVPCFEYQDDIVFGQDKLALIEQRIVQKR